MKLERSNVRGTREPALRAMKTEFLRLAWRIAASNDEEAIGTMLSNSAAYWEYIKQKRAIARQGGLKT